MKDDSDIEYVVRKAASKDSEALASLIAHHEVEQHLDNASAWAEAQFNQDRNDVRQFIAEKLCDKIDTIRNPRCLDLWCYKVARRYCLNEIRHKDMERAYVDYIRASLESKRHNHNPMLDSGAVLTPEQEFLNTEQEALVKDKARIKATVLRVAKQYPDWLVKAWASIKPPSEIIKETGMSSATVYRRLREMQKAIRKALEEIGLERESMLRAFEEIKHELLEKKNDI